MYVGLSLKMCERYTMCASVWKWRKVYTLQNPPLIITHTHSSHGRETILQIYCSFSSLNLALMLSVWHFYVKSFETYNINKWRFFFSLFFFNKIIIQTFYKSIFTAQRHTRVKVNNKINKFIVAFKYNFYVFISVGWASWQSVQGFGEQPTIKSQLLNLLRSVRTVARGILLYIKHLYLPIKHTVFKLFYCLFLCVCFYSSTYTPQHTDDYN